MNSAYAQEIMLNIARENYNIKETLQAELKFNVDVINKITASNFFLLNENNSTIPISLFLEKISKDYYYAYFNLPEINPGIHTFEVRDIRYIDENGLLKQVSVRKYFNLLNQTLDNTSISINPGIILQNQKLTLINNLNPVNVQIEAPSYTNLSKNILLMNRYSFDVFLYEQSYTIRIIYNNKNYDVPVIKLNNLVQNDTIIQTTPPINSIIFLNSTFGEKFPTEINLERTTTIYNPIYIKNIWNRELTNVTFTISGDLNEVISLDRHNFDLIQSEETRKQILIINEDKNATKSSYSGSVIVTSNEGTLSNLNLKLNFYSQNNLTVNVTQDGIVIFNRTDNKTQPQPEGKPKSGTTFIMIIIILAVIALIIYFMFKRKIIQTETFGEHFKYKFKR